MTGNLFNYVIDEIYYQNVILKQLYFSIKHNKIANNYHRSSLAFK